MQNQIRTYRYWASAAILVVAASGAWVSTARAADDIVNVVDQARYQFAPYGIRAGSFLFSPGIGVSETYDDNVYRTETNTSSDFITTVNPSLGAVSDFDLHEISLDASGSFGRYADNDSEDFNDYNINGGLRLDFDYATFLNLTSSYKKDHERRESENDPNADEPVTYFLTTHKAAFTRALGVIKLYLEGIYNSFTYEDVKAGNLRIDNSGRDRDVYSADARLAYEYFPGYNIYAAITYDWRRYDNRGASIRDSDGVNVRFGTDVFVTGKIKADIYGGYLRRNYEGNFDAISDFNYGGSVIWNATGLTSLTAAVDRGVDETIYGDASGNLGTSFSLGIDHMLRDNLFLSANASLGLSEFDGRTTPRDDTTYGAGVGVEYIPYNGTALNLKYDYRERDSSVVLEDYTDNRVTLSFSKRF